MVALTRFFSQNNTFSFSCFYCSVGVGIRRYLIMHCGKLELVCTANRLSLYFTLGVYFSQQYVFFLKTKQTFLEGVRPICNQRDAPHILIIITYLEMLL